MKTLKYPVENSVITNNFRIYYMELYNQIPAFNITAFAKICDLPFMSASRYLIEGIVPRYRHVLEKVENRLGKPRGDIFVEREVIAWNEQEVTWAHPSRPEARKGYTQEESSQELLVAEDEIEYGNSLSRELANAQYIASLTKAYIQLIAEGKAKFDAHIITLISTPRL